MDDKKVDIELDLEQELIDELKRIAAREGITVDEVVEMAIRSAMEAEGIEINDAI